MDTELFKKIEDASLILLTGQTGSGKSVLVRSYFKYMADKFNAEQWGIRAYDVVGHEYSKTKPNPYVRRIRDGGPGVNGEIEEDIDLIKRRADGGLAKAKKYTIHVNECDLMVNEDLSSSFIKLLLTASEIGKQANVQIIYETSRIGSAAMPKEIIQSADLRLQLNGPSAEYEDINGHPFGNERIAYLEQKGNLLCVDKQGIESRYTTWHDDYDESLWENWWIHKN